MANLIYFKFIYKTGDTLITKVDNFLSKIDEYSKEGLYPETMVCIDEYGNTLYRVDLPQIP